MPKAGIFAGEVTQAAPADGAATLKAKGYHWMEYGNVIVPPTAPDQSRVIALFDFEESSGGVNTRLYSTNEPAWYYESQNGYISVGGFVGKGAQVTLDGSQFHQLPYEACH